MKIRIDFSQAERTPAGNFLSHLYYQTHLIDVFNRDERTGSPHNGGKHTLHVQADMTDVVAFLDLIEELYPKGHQRHDGAQAFLAFARAEVNKKERLHAIVH